MLAYHVHEKAIMTAIIPMTLLAPTSRQNAQLYLRTCAFGHFGLLPLLYKRTELLYKTTSYIAHLSLAVFMLEHALNKPQNSSPISLHRDSNKNGLITFWDQMGLMLLSLLLLFSEGIHPILFQPKQKFEFLPLMMISVSCAVGLVGCWIHSLFLMRKCAQTLAAREINEKMD